MSETFAKRLRRLRDEQGLNIVSLALAVGTSEGTIRQLESGNVKAPNFLLGLRLADYFKVDPRYLAFGESINVAERLESLERSLKALETIERRVAKLEQRIASLPQTRR